MVDSSETLNPTWTFNVGKRPRPTNQRTKHQKTNKKVYFIANSTTDTLKQQAQESKAFYHYLFIGKGKELFGSWVQTYFFGRCGSHRTEWG
jgi:hypothetical protein